MWLRRGHRLFGGLLLLPLLAWALTGLVFFLKPGYGDAYASPAVKTYPLETEISLPPISDGYEFRLMRTLLGRHLLVRDSRGAWLHLNARTGEPWPEPDEGTMRLLLEDALGAAPERYGEILGLEGGVATTSTGVRVSWNWERLALYQRGRDTDLIDKLYDIHYLRWTGVAWLDRLAGMAGLVLIWLLGISGSVLLLKKAR